LRGHSVSAITHPPTPPSFPTRRSSDLTIMVSNVGPSDALGVSLADSLPSELVSSTAKYCVDGVTPPCNPSTGTAWSSPLSLNTRSEEHTSELQSRGQLECRLLLENTTN